MTAEKYRLVTRSDFDGIVCAALFKELDMIDSVHFAHPRDLQHGLIPITNKDIIANLPYNEDAHLVFDHHASEALRLEKTDTHDYVFDPDAPSASHLIYDFYGGEKRFKTIPKDLIEAVDKADTAAYSKEEILNPTGWTLLNFIMDVRTGLGAFKDFALPHEDLMRKLSDMIRTDDADSILNHPDVVERLDVYKMQEPLFKKQLEKAATFYGDLVVLDLRHEVTLYAGNRFMVYAMYPQVHTSLHVLNSHDPALVLFAAGRSIINRSATADIGALMLENGGGGHQAAGSCQVTHERAEEMKKALIEALSGHPASCPTEKPEAAL